MLGKEALLLMQGKKEPMLSIPNGWGGTMAYMHFQDSTSINMDKFGSRFPDYKVPISLLAKEAISEDGLSDNTPSLVNVRKSSSGMMSYVYHIIDPTKDAEIRW